MANIRPSLHFYGMIILVKTKPLCRGMAWLQFQKDRSSMGMMKNTALKSAVLQISSTSTPALFWKVQRQHFKIMKLLLFKIWPPLPTFGSFLAINFRRRPLIFKNWDFHYALFSPFHQSIHPNTHPWLSSFKKKLNSQTGSLLKLFSNFGTVWLK